MSNIALVDDDRNILISLSMTLEAEDFHVETYTDGRTALDAFDERMPDLAVLDIKMPKMDGLDLLQRVRKKSAVPILVLSSKDDEVDEIVALRMGADAYVKKPFSQRVLLERIRALLRRQRAGAAETTDDKATPEVSSIVCGPLVMDSLRHEASWKGKSLTLTGAEFLLLWALASEPGVVMSRDQLLDVVRHDGADPYDRSIDGHIKRLRKKMHDADQTFSAIETLYGIGYRYIGT
ncbi:MAG: response regulator transcription factor [Limimaricola soesokkakensis]|uniref:response regulator transcription factor n=1 Tax=Limimaricola soesokkakensis TaxID=1343159 RepID=UPI0040588AC7